MRILAAQINPTIGDFEGNTKKILNAIETGRSQGVNLVLFPELALSGYPPEDFLIMPHFIWEAEKHLDQIVAATEGIAVIVGLPRKNPDHTQKSLFNSAAIIEDRKILGYQDKTLLPTYDVFDELRYFEPCRDVKIWTIGERRIGVTICEDIWQHSELIKYTSYERDPILDLKPFKLDLMLNLSASPYSIGKFQDRLYACSSAARTLKCPVLLCNQVGGNDSLIFDGYSLYVGKDGLVSDYAPGFVEGYLLADLTQRVGIKEIVRDDIEDLYRALVLGLHDYFSKSGFKKACLGLSGGVDSAVVACIAAEALGPENVLALWMPSRYSPPSSSNDAKQLVENLGIACEEISIEWPFQSYLDLLRPHFGGLPEDATEENLQARIRGMIQMAISNKRGYIVLSTGNKSELAMGYATLYGDMCGGLAVINDVTKMQVWDLARWINREREIIPWNTINKPPSAELRPNQTDQDTLPEYPIVDNVLQAYVEEHMAPKHIAEKFGYPQELVDDLIQRIHRSEYKRRQGPPGLRVSEKAFSVGRRFPIVQRFVPG